MSSEENDLFPKIIVDPAAVGYAETDEELEEEEAIEIPSDDEKPDIPKVEKNVLRKTRKKKEIFQVSEEEAPVQEKPNEPAEESVTRRPRKKITQAQLDHLAGARVKALEARRRKKAEKLKQKENPAVEVPKQTVTNMHSVSNIAREMNDEQVDRLIDRYKERRKSKKLARAADQHTKKLIMSHYSDAELPVKSNYTLSDFF
jgi:hypothetical protein